MPLVVYDHPFTIRHKFISTERGISGVQMEPKFLRNQVFPVLYAIDLRERACA